MKVLFIVKSLFKRALKNKYSLLIYILIPIIGIIIPIFIYSNDNVDEVNIKILDEDRSNTSIQLVNILEDRLNCIEEEQKNNLASNILKGEYDLLIIIPKEFGNNLLEKDDIKVSFLYMKDNEKIYIAKEIVNECINRAKEILKITNNDEESFNEIYGKLNNKETNIKYNVLSENNNILSTSCLGFIILFMMIIINSSLSTIIQDKNNNVQKRFLYSSIKSKEYIGAQIIWSFLLYIIQCIIIFMTFKVFKINLDIGNIQLFYILVIIWFVSISIDIFSISFCRSEEQLTIINTIIVFPSCMLSGCLWPIDIMEKTMQNISLILPQRHIILLLEQLQRNENIYVIIVNILYIFLVSLLLLTIGIIKIDNNNFKEIV